MLHVCTVCLPAFILQHSVNRERERASEREGKKQRGKVEAQCNYRLSWNGNEVDGDRGGKGVSAEQDITE